MPRRDRLRRLYLCQEKHHRARAHLLAKESRSRRLSQQLLHQRRAQEVNLERRRPGRQGHCNFL